MTRSNDDPYGIWCAIAADLRNATNALKAIGLSDYDIRNEMIELVNKCVGKHDSHLIGELSMVLNKQIDQLKIIEKALDLELYPWQKLYILTGECNPPPGRGVGKTTAYCIRLALTPGVSYSIRTIDSLRDEDHGSSYTRWFRDRFLTIRDRLERYGIPVCGVSR